MFSVQHESKCCFVALTLWHFSSKRVAEATQSVFSVTAMLALTGSVFFESFMTKTFLTDACVSREHMTGCYAYSGGLCVLFWT